MNESQPIRILVVDDEPTIRHLLKRWIARSTTAEVIEAENGLQGLEALASGKVDLVILDINMPVLNGIEMLSLIRADPLNASLEVIVASMIGSEAQVREVISLGVSDYVLKPLQHDRVLMRLEAATRRILDRRQQRAAPGDSSRTRILVADGDPNFCETAVAALSTQFSTEAVKTTAEVLVKVLRFKPDLVLISAAMAGTQLSFLLDKIHNLSKSRTVSVYALVDSPSESVTDAGIAGCVRRTFVPETFASQIVALLGGGPAPDRGILSWISSLEPEIHTAMRQALGMMTGAEPTETEAPAEAPGFDLFGQIRLESANHDFELLVEIECRQALARGLVKMMLGIPEEEIDEATQASGLQEILNVIAGRIKNSCQERAIEVMLGLPDISSVTPVPPRDILHEKRLCFLWDDKHLFQLTFYGCTLRLPADAQAKRVEPVATLRPTEAPAGAATGVQGSPAPQVAEPPSKFSGPPTPTEASTAAESNTPSPDTGPESTGAAEALPGPATPKEG